MLPAAAEGPCRPQEVALLFGCGIAGALMICSWPLEGAAVALPGTSAAAAGAAAGELTLGSFWIEPPLLLMPGLGALPVPMPKVMLVLRLDALLLLRLTSIAQLLLLMPWA
jgi:hypothetical protein